MLMVHSNRLFLVRLAEITRLLGKTKREIAALLGLSRQTLHSFLTGR
jgi:DNA-binding XRE family transcriptional regulator